jgi:hypothetical protein
MKEDRTVVGDTTVSSSGDCGSVCVVERNSVKTVPGERSGDVVEVGWTRSAGFGKVLYVEPSDVYLEIN